MPKQKSNPYALYPEDEPAPPTPPSQQPMGRPLDRGRNKQAVIGVILALLGPLAPVGVVVSLLALRHEPRGTAWVGVVLGVVMTVMTLGCGGLIGFGVWAVLEGEDEYAEIASDYRAISVAIEEYRQHNNDALPADLGALGLPADVTTDPYGDTYLYTQRSGAWYLGFNGYDGYTGSDDDVELANGLTIGGYTTDPYQPLQEAVATGAMMELLD